VNSKLTMTSKASSDSGPSSDGRTGFQAQIKGASLGDLVQMECLAGSHRAVKVTSGGNVGYLYFRSGAVVHATARALVGESAALEILSWSEGSFEPVDREWPVKESVACGWQSLLLRAAHARDERAAQSVVALRSDGRGPAIPSANGQAMARSKPAPALVPETVEFQATPIEIAGHVLRSEDFEVVLRLDADGSLAVNRGGSQDFADIVAYACRLAEIIGTRVGIERFMAMECTFKGGRCFLVLEANGDVVALRPNATSEVSALRSLLGL
jgi:hypothetical protein